MSQVLRYRRNGEAGFGMPDSCRLGVLRSHHCAFRLDREMRGSAVESWPMLERPSAVERVLRVTGSTNTILRTLRAG